MSTKQNKAIERRYLEEVWNKGNVALTDEFLTANYVYHGPGGLEVKGIEGMKQFTNGARIAFPDIHFTIEDMVAEGDIIMYRYTGRGTFTGEFMGIAPTGKKVTYAGFMQDHFEDNKIVETWELIDRLGFYQQMGVAPPKRQ
jgi:predicted ester cyclase